MPDVIDTRPAGPDHQVLTLIGPGATNPYRRTPCETCPWRVDMIGEFPAEAFRHSANVGIDASWLPWHNDPQRAAARLANADHTFACHDSGQERPATCAGYILRGDQALSWRLAVGRGQFDPITVSDAGHPLHENYRAMAEANGVPANDPALDGCTPVHRGTE